MMGLILQRVFLVLGLLGAYFVYAQAAPMTQHREGLPGLWLLSSGSAARALGAMGVAMFAAACIGALAGFWQRTHALTGIFVYSAGLAWLLLGAGSIEPWLKTAASADAYWRLAGETAVWGGLTWAACRFIVGLWLMWHGRREPEPDQISSSADVAVRPVVWFDSDRRGHTVVDEVIAAGAAVALGIALTFVFVRSADAKQVVWGVFLAYTITGSLVRSYLPTASVRGVLLSPLIAGFLGYCAMAVWGVDSERALSDYYASDSWAIGLVMPVHYASAGVAGIAAGVIWSYAASIQTPATPEGNPGGSAGV